MLLDASEDADWTELTRRARTRLFQWGIDALCAVSKLHPVTDPDEHGVKVVRDVAYIDDGDPAHTLDVYCPPGDTPRPALVYLHGGSFSRLSKDIYWFVALTLARKGFTVFNINFRLAPQHRYPAGLADAAAACIWVKQNAERYGADPRRFLLAGDSSGANFATALTIASCYERPEPWARTLWDAKLDLRAVAAACGILQVSDAARLARRRRLPGWVVDFIEDIPAEYLPAGVDRDGCPLADPLLVLEQAEPPARPLPPFLAPVGTRDPLLDDTRRLKAALARLGVPCEMPVYPGGIHGFHVLLPWQKRSGECWNAYREFFAKHATAAP